MGTGLRTAFRPVPFAAALILTLVVPSAAIAQESLLAIERPDRIVDEIRRLPDTVEGASNEANEANEAASEAERLVAAHSAFESAFDPDAFMASVGSTLPADDGDQDDTRLGEIAARLDEARSAVAAGTVEAAPSAPNDMTAIDALVPLMASAGLYAELALSANRLQHLLTLPAERWTSDDIDATSVEEDAAAFIGESRLASETEDLSETWIAEGEARLRTELAQLPDEDLAVLLRFYESEAVRGQRDELVDAFAYQNDAAGVRMLVAFYAALQSDR